MHGIISRVAVFVGCVCLNGGDEVSFSPLRPVESFIKNQREEGLVRHVLSGDRR